MIRRVVDSDPVMVLVSLDDSVGSSVSEVVVEKDHESLCVPVMELLGVIRAVAVIWALGEPDMETRVTVSVRVTASVRVIASRLLNDCDKVAHD